MTYDKAKVLAGIIIRVKLGIASLEERDVLGRWLDECEENRQLYKSIIRGESIKRRLKLEDEINQTTDFKKIHQNLSKRLIKKNSKRKLLVRMYVGGGIVAACLCGVIMMLPFLKEVKLGVSVDVNYELAVLDVKKDKVMLVLDGGKQISLVNHVPDSIKLSQVTLIGEEGKLSYEPNMDTTSREEIRHKIYTTVGGDYSLVLSDGTRVWLNSESELEYPIRFIGKERVVKLSGEAYFEVTPDPARPFIVEVSDTRTRVLGTSFNISGYADEKTICTTLLTGRVEVSLSDARSGVSPVVLKPGMQSQWEKGTGEFVIKQANVEDVVAWRYGVFVFDEYDIELVTRMLSRWYEVKFVYDSGRVGRHTFSGKMSKDENLESILKMLTLAGGPEFKIDHGIVHIIEKR